MARWFFLENLMEVSREVLESFFPGRFLEALKLFLIKIILLLREGGLGGGSGKLLLPGAARADDGKGK